MAVWQFKVQLIPTVWVERGNDVMTLFKEEGYEGIEAWKHRIDVEQIRSAIDMVLPRGKEWNKDLTLWGNEKSDDIQLWLDQQCIESLSIRFDLRDRNIALISNVVSLAKQLDLSIITTEQRHNVGTNLDDLLLLFENSCAQGFKNPDTFISSFR